MKIIIAGACEVGSHLAKLLAAYGGNDITLIDPEEGRLESVIETADIVTICGDSSSIRILQEAAVDKADLFVAVHPAREQHHNISSALLAKKLGCPKVVARVSNEEYLSYDNRILFTDMGIDLMFYPEQIAAQEIANTLKNAGASESLDFARGRLQLSVVTLDASSPVLDARLIAENLYIHFRIVAVSRMGETIIPGPDFKFKEKDTIYLVTLRESLEPLLRALGFTMLQARRVMILGGSNTGSMVARMIAPTTQEVKIIDKNRFNCLIEVDGGINDETGKLCREAGVDILVAGSYLFGHDDFIERVKLLR